MKIGFKDKVIGVIGLGYVGLPLAIEFGKKFTTIGYDINENRIEELKSSLEIAPSINWNTTGSVSMSSRLANKKENEDIQDVEFDSNLNKNKSEESNNDLKEELEENHD